MKNFIRLNLLLLAHIYINAFGQGVRLGYSFTNEFYSYNKAIIDNQNYKTHSFLINPGVGICFQIAPGIMEDKIIDIGGEVVYLPLAFSFNKKTLGGYLIPLRIGYRNQSFKGAALGISLGYQVNNLDLYRNNNLTNRSGFKYNTYTIELLLGFAADKIMSSSDLFFRYGNSFSKKTNSFNLGIRVRFGGFN